jgi:hypothetical protein
VLGGYQLLNILAHMGITSFRKFMSLVVGSKGDFLLVCGRYILDFEIELALVITPTCF